MSVSPQKIISEADSLLSTENNRQLVNYFLEKYSQCEVYTRPILMEYYRGIGEYINPENIGMDAKTIRLALSETGIYLDDKKLVTRIYGAGHASADKNPTFSTNPGNATNDKIFLLSIAEAEKYFTSDEARNCDPTAYAKAQWAYTSDSYKTASGEASWWWWLRSPGKYQNYAASVYSSDHSNGSVSRYGINVDYDNNDCVRPAFWINLES